VSPRTVIIMATGGDMTGRLEPTTPAGIDGMSSDDGSKVRGETALVDGMASSSPTQPVVLQAGEAFIDGYDPANPWQSELCLATDNGDTIVVFPLNPSTLPALLGQLRQVQHAQATVTGAPSPTAGLDPDDDGADEQDQGVTDRARRWSGWSGVNVAWQRPFSRITMIAIVVIALAVGALLSYL